MTLKGKPGTWKPTKALAPVRSAKPSAPTGEVERWLVAHSDDYGVLCVVWARGWFAARDLAAWDLKLPRDSLLLAPIPLWPEEKEGQQWSAVQLAARCEFWLHVEQTVLDAVFAAEEQP